MSHHDIVQRWANTINYTDFSRNPSRFSQRWVKKFQYDLLLELFWTYLSTNQQTVEMLFIATKATESRKKPFFLYQGGERMIIKLMFYFYCLTFIILIILLNTYFAVYKKIWLVNDISFKLKNHIKNAVMYITALKDFDPTCKLNR